MRRYDFSFLAALLLFAVLASGCGGGSNSNFNSDTGTPPQHNNKNKLQHLILPTL